MKMLTAAMFATAFATAAIAQPAPQGPTEYTLRLSADDTNAIGVAINELPAKIANPLTQRIIGQIQAQNDAFKKTHEPKPDAPAPTKPPK